MFGLRDVSFKWNVVEEKGKDKNHDKKDKKDGNGNGKKRSLSDRKEDLEAAVRASVAPEDGSEVSESDGIVFLS